MSIYKHIELSYLVSMADGNKQIIKDIIELFKVEMPKNINVLEDCIVKKNWTNLSAIAHKSKSSVKIVGLNKLSEKLMELEYNAKKEENIETYQETLDLFKSTFYAAIEELDQFVLQL